MANVKEKMAEVEKRNLEINEQIKMLGEKRADIDRQLANAGWVIQDRAQMNLYAGRGVAVREFPLQTGEADYLLFVDRKAVGVVEAKPEGTTLSGVAQQAARYSVGLAMPVPPRFADTSASHE
jgi:type I site-specific restriction endonuclease